MEGEFCDGQANAVCGPAPGRRDAVSGTDRKRMVGAIGFEFWGRRSFNNIETTAGTVKQWKAVLTDHKWITNGSRLVPI